MVHKVKMDEELARQITIFIGTICNMADAAGMSRGEVVEMTLQVMMASHLEMDGDYSDMNFDVPNHYSSAKRKKHGRRQ